jgi:rRNA-processing protein FCF1
VRVFLDANILFSAAKSNGAVREFLARMLQAGHQLVADDYVVAEARRNLETLGVEPVGALDVLLRSIEVSAFRAARLPADLETRLPAKDRPILAAAIRLRCHALVTGDRTHFGSLYGTVQHGVAVHSPRSLAESLSL